MHMKNFRTLQTGPSQIGLFFLTPFLRSDGWKIFFRQIDLRIEPQPFEGFKGSVNKYCKHYLLPPRMEIDDS